MGAAIFNMDVRICDARASISQVVCIQKLPVVEMLRDTEPVVIAHDRSEI